MTAALLIAATMLDSVTYLLMGVEQETNPIVAGLGPVVSLGLRWSAVAILLLVGPRLVHSRRYYLLGAYAAALGAATNTRVIANIAGFGV